MLMYQQAELLYDEEELGFASRCNEKISDKKCFNHSWKEISHNPGAVDLWKKVNDVQEKLRSYYDLLALAAAVEKLPAPNKLSLSFLQNWVKHRDRGDDFLLDIEAEAWDSSIDNDYVVLSPQTAHDGLAETLHAFFVPLYHRYIGSRKSPLAHGRYGKVWHYRFERFVLLGNILSVLLATWILAGSVVILYLVSNMWLRLLIITIFCLLFACIMSFIAGARRVDVFAATAAFAAVQVVFVGGATLVQTA